MSVKLNDKAYAHAKSLIADGKATHDERDDMPNDTKGHYSFPFGDFSKVHRCAVISLESRAAQYDHDEIADATKDLLNRIDDKG